MKTCFCNNEAASEPKTKQLSRNTKEKRVALAPRKHKNMKIWHNWRERDIWKLSPINNMADRSAVRKMRSIRFMASENPPFFPKKEMTCHSHSTPVPPATL